MRENQSDRRGRPKAVILKSAAVVGTFAAAALVAGLASMPASASVSNGNLNPAASISGHSFYTDAQIDSAWAAVVKDYPQPLPYGVTFPTKAPAFFHPADAKNNLWESGLPALLAARYWRCAWLDADLKGAPTSSKLESTSNLNSAYQSLPDVSSHVDVSAYQKSIDDYAASIGVDAKRAEFSIDCQIYTEGQR